MLLVNPQQLNLLGIIMIPIYQTRSPVLREGEGLV